MKMNRKISWKERYKIALCENLTLKEIQKLRNVGQPKAIEIRKKVIEYCLVNDIEIDSPVGIPTEIVLNITGYNLEYYYTKMKLEIEMEILQVNQTRCVSTA